MIDRRAMAARPLAKLLAGVLENGRRRMADRRVRGFDAAAGEPTEGQCRELVDAVRPDFEFFESPRSRARRIEEEVRRFTEEQFTALDSMARNPRVVFDGPAGTGKTLLAMEAARRAADRGSRVLFVCFNLPLRFWLADQLAELRPEGMADRLGVALGAACEPDGGGDATACDGSGPGVIVRSLHEQMLHVAGLQPEGRDVSAPFWLEELPEKACERLLEQQVALDESPAAAAPDVVDEIVVDEAQDILNANYLEFLDLSLRGGLEKGRWRVFGDFEFQRIYREHGSMTLEEFDPEGRWPVCRLLVNCRNTPSVAELACACVGVDPSYCRVLRDDDRPPEIHAWDDAEDQARLLAKTLEELHDDGFAWDDIVVLSTVADVRSACASLPSRPWADRLEHVTQYEPGLDLSAAGDRASHRRGRVRCATIHRFKGLEARAVVITDVTQLDETTRALLYVGATRTVERLVLLAGREPARDLRRLLAHDR